MSKVFATKARFLSGYETLLCHPLYAEKVFADLHAPDHSPEAFDRMRGEDGASGYGGYRIENGTALVPIMGSLISRGTFAGPRFGMTSYEGLRSELRAATADAAVSRIALLIDSPGGAVSGIDATAAAILTAAQRKPVTAYVQGMAASAAYWLASQADEIVASPLAEIGSIGVVSAHVDVSKAMESYGIKVTLLHSGARKIDGNPYEPLPDDVRAEWLKSLDALRLQFAAAVADGRGIKAEQALATEAATYLAEEAQGLGLIDRIGFLDDELNPAQSATILRFPPAAGRQDKITGEGVASAVPSGASEKDRISAILMADAARGREDFARYLALETDISVGEALAALSHAPKAQDPALAAPDPAAQLNAEMAAYGNPRVGADGGKSFDSMSDYEKGAASMKALLAKVGDVTG